MTIRTQRAGPRPLPQDFEKIFQENQALVYRTANRITGNPDDAEDVLQILFLRLIRREFPPDIQSNPKPYLHRAAVNIALDIVKARNRNVSADEIQIDVEDHRPTPDRDHASAEIQTWLRQALAELSPKTAEMFVLRHVEGYENEEIAKMLGTSKGTVAVMLFRARLRLKAAIRAKWGESI